MVSSLSELNIIFGLKIDQIMKFKSIYTVLVLMLLVSCGSTKTATSNEISAQESSVYQKSLVAEMEVDLTKKIKGTAVVTNGNEEEAKNMAKWNAIESSGAHAIIEPIFNIERTGSTVNCSVQGYYGVFSSIETATEQDLLNYVRVNLLSGTGILQVSFPQFKAFYYSLAGDNENVLSEDELQWYYEEEYELAIESQENSERNNVVRKKGQPAPGEPNKGLGGVVLLLLLLSLVGAVVALVSY